jgi:hypothetical protein
MMGRHIFFDGLHLLKEALGVLTRSAYILYVLRTDVHR